MAAKTIPGQLALFVPELHVSPSILCRAGHDGHCPRVFAMGLPDHRGNSHGPRINDVCTCTCHTGRTFHA